MGIKQLQEEEKGSGLVLTLMVLLVLSVLGVALGTLTIGSYQLSDATRDNTSTYYVAEAGVVAAYDQIQREVLSAYKNNTTEGAFYSQVSTILSSKNGQSSIKFDQQLGSKPTATIRTEKENAQKYTIYSTGKIDGKERTVTKPVTVKWVEKNTAGGGMQTLPAKTALLVNEEMKLLGGTLKDNAYIQSIKDSAVQVGTYGSFKESTLHYSSQTTPGKLINYPNYMKNNLPKFSIQVENVNFKDYEDLLTHVKVPTDNTIDFKKLPDKIIKKMRMNSIRFKIMGICF
ncbi:PilX N-terminal [Carnobacterium iners]|uniref:PilX N-terminal n=1 Tax=Carnobacterium iners TaxID=1073423 RepID=A0A1X7NB67_9LACT|nr:PilX N-terminal domain-containing pilus assembly protein [Carnobacterium iners]SMH34375.1 PilX N-terminal [Carnobacterium iners]